MQVIALISGGKDSFLSILHCISAGHQIVALANLYPPHPGCSEEVSEVLPEDIQDGQEIDLETSAEGNEDLDSFMYQTVGHQVLPLYARLLNLPLHRKAITGSSANQELVYTVQSGGNKDETEDLYILLKHILSKYPTATAITSGAILSNYQRTRVESVATRLGLTSLAPLWERPQLQVLADLEKAGVDARTIKVAAVGLGEKWLWRNVGDVVVRRYLEGLREKFGVHPAGEGGEFETLVVGGPGFRAGVEAEWESVMRGDVGFVNVKRVTFVKKGGEGVPGLKKEDVGIDRQYVLEKGFRKVLGKLAAWKEEDVKSTPIQTTLSNLPPFTVSSTPHHITLSNIPFTTLDSVEFKSQVTTLLTTHSLTPQHITSTLLLLPSMSLFPTVNTLYTALFGTSPPSRTCIAISPKLLPAQFLLSLTAQKGLGAERSTLHIQSHSHWAPACIGPYSQAVKTPLGVELAGQIGLVPFTGELNKDESGDKRVEILLALQNLCRVARRMEGKDMPDIKVPSEFENSDDDDEEEDENELEFPLFESLTAYCSSPASKAVLEDLWRIMKPGFPLIITQVYELPRLAAAEFHAVLAGPKSKMSTFWTGLDEELVREAKEEGDSTVFVDINGGEPEDLEKRGGRVVRCLRVWVVDGRGEKTVQCRKAGWRRSIVEEREDGDSDSE